MHEGRTRRQAGGAESVNSRTALTVDRPRDEVERLRRSTQYRTAYIDGSDAAVTFKEARETGARRSILTSRAVPAAASSARWCRSPSALRRCRQSRTTCAPQAARRDRRGPALRRVARGRAEAERKLKQRPAQ